MYSATMPKFDVRYLTTPQSIIPDYVSEFADCFYTIISITNEWLLSTGDEFILAPDYYVIS